MDIHSVPFGEGRQVYEKAQGSQLYSALKQKMNPSSTSSHIKEEMAEVTRWVNQYLGLAGYSDHLVTDLAADMADGITLLRLVHAVTNEPLPKHFHSPLMRVQKLENLQTCLLFLQQRGLTLTAVHAEDIVTGNVKSVLAICHALKRHFTGGASVSPTQHREPHRPSQTGLWATSLDREDMALLSWIGGVVHKDIPDYTVLYDGKILCELMNEAHEGAIPEKDIAMKTAEERLKLAFKAGEKYLFITRGSIDISRVLSGLEDGKIKSYLNQYKQTYRKIEARRQLKAVQRQREGGSKWSRRNAPSREDVFESLKSANISSSLEQREAARIASRTYEGIRQKKLSSSEYPPRTLSSPTDSTSTSTTSVSSSAHTSPPHKPLHSSHDHLPTSRQPHSSKKPLSDIYVTGASSYSDLTTTRNDHSELIRPKSMTKHSSAEGLEADGGEETTFPSRGIHRSMDSGIASRRKTSSPGSSWGSSSGGYDSDSLATSSLSQKPNVNKESRSFTLPRRSKSQSDTNLSPPPLPSVPPPSSTLLNRSLTKSSERVNQPTFEPFGGRLAPRRSGSYTRLDSSTADELSTQIADLQERISMLTLHFLYDKADLCKQLHRAVLKERKKRQEVEKRLKQVEKMAEQLTRHYDNCFIQLAKDVSSLKATVGQQRGTTPTVSPEIKQQRGLGASDDQTNRQLFLRKRSHSDSVPPHGPFLRGSATRLKKLSNFFGEEPPYLEDLQSLLDGLGYGYLLPKFLVHRISIAELRHMDDSHLETLGIPLGPRVRILSEVKKLVPLDNVSDVI